MGKNAKNCLWISLVGMIALGLLALLLRFYLIPNLLDQKRLLTSPPDIHVTSPVNGEQFLEGSILYSKATASGTYPIARVELWLDDELYAEKSSPGDTELDLYIMYVDFPIEVTPGTHMLYWRAVDNKGQIGQTLPIMILGTERPDITIQDEGQTLQEVAEALGEDLQALENLNPGLGGADIPVGTAVNLPQQTGNQAGGGAPQPGPIDLSGAYILLPADPINPIINFRSIVSVLLTALPAAPTGLTVGLDNCMVQLRWMDNATNEQNYHIYMCKDQGNCRTIADLPPRRGTGLAAYSFHAPGPGTYYFWVYAVNELGKQPNQHYRRLDITQACPGALATQLEVEPLDLQTSAQTGQTYCYISLEGGPYHRYPDNNFFNDFVNTLIGNKIIIPIPQDDEVTVEGECLNHHGNHVTSLGTFSVSNPRQQWDGSRLQAQGDSFALGYRIQFHGSEEAQGFYRYTDFELPAPKVISVEAESAEDPINKSRLARKIILKWDWNGNRDEINSFVVAWDDVDEYLYVGKDLDWEVPVTLPSSCGNTFEFAVAAVGGGGARSPYSERYEYKQPDCELYAEVIFDSFELVKHEDQESFRDYPCDEAELHFGFYVRSATVDRMSSWHGTPTKCHIPMAPERYPLGHSWESERYRNSNIFLVAIDPNDYALSIYVYFYDEDFLSDLLCVFDGIIYNTPDDWPNYKQEFVEICEEGDEDDFPRGVVKLNFRVRGFSTPRDE